MKYCVHREHFGDDVPGVCRSAAVSDDAMEDKYFWIILICAENITCILSMSYMFHM